MKSLLRILGIALALFLLISAVADVAGVIPHSTRMPSLIFRFRQNFVPIVAGILLLVNSKKLQGGAQLFTYLIALFAVSTWYSLGAMRFVAGFFRGHNSFHVMPIELLILAIFWGTFWTAINQHFAPNRQ